MNQFELLIAGGGLAAARAIKSYREAGGGGRIALLSQEATLPYHRPALSKRYLRSETDTTPHVENEAFYRDNDVEVVLETTVAAANPEARRVFTEKGSIFGYGKLLIATGATPRHLAVPGADLAGVFSLRTVADSAAIRDAAAASERAVVVGGGFIGSEVAASLRQLGLSVTLIHLGDGLFDQLGSEQVSEELGSLYRENGVELVLGDRVTAFRGGTGLAAVETKNGRAIEADLAVVGVGVVPAVEFLADSGLALHNGVVVDERFQASAPDVHAVGDVANFFDPLFQRRRRIEHWSNASYQGTLVGRVLAGEDGRYDTVSSFFTEAFGISLKVFGDVATFDEAVPEGSLLDRELVVRYIDSGRLVGALTVGQDEAVETELKQLIARRAPVTAARAEPRLAAATAT
jgi:NADPH-dependent 2,4-dienoyl-CoA reductase/sulfur reductase-like enzyme